MWQRCLVDGKECKRPTHKGDVVSRQIFHWVEMADVGDPIMGDEIIALRSAMEDLWRNIAGEDIMDLREETVEIALRNHEMIDRVEESTGV